MCAILSEGQMGAMGSFIREVLFGAFGFFAYVVPLLFILFGIMRIVYSSQKANKSRYIAGALLALFLMCLLHMLAHTHILHDTYPDFLQQSYAYSQENLVSGGVTGALIIWPLIRLLGVPGAYILIVTGILICLILITNFSLKAAGENVGQAISQQMEVRRERRRSAKLYNEDLARSIEQEQEAARLKYSGGADYQDDLELLEKSMPRISGLNKKPAILDTTRLTPEEAESYQARRKSGKKKKTSEPAGGPKKLVAAATPLPKGVGEEDFRVTSSGTYSFPPVELLDKPKNGNALEGEREARQKAKLLIDTLASFDVAAKVVQVTQGPAVTRFELQPAAGVKVNRIVNLADDIALNMASQSLRIEAPIPGKAAIGIEISNNEVRNVTLREIIDSTKFKSAASRLSIALGKDISGNNVVADISRMPHLLIAGATGSGKSVCINSMLISLLYKATPEEVRLILIDPKVVELSVYNGIPHLLVPVVTDPKKAAGALNSAVAEMTRRYQLFAEAGVRDIQHYNEYVDHYEADSDEEKPERLYQLVIIIDELHDLMMVAPKDVEASIMRLAQMARAAGIYLVIATQRPSVDVITGVIKANIPSRIALAVSSQVDSRTIIDGAGAERLLGHGDMLFNPSGAIRPTRVQGAFVSDAEVERIVQYIK
ncbi:MAG: DNA translocase FtsK 4TM domain-containing protein, partial [Christensenellales bacterium]